MTGTRGFTRRVLLASAVASPAGLRHATVVRLPDLVAAFPADQITPACRQMTHDS
jgi:hypothetical protein